jgi:hypothetical protein
MVSELNAAKRLILKHFKLVIESLMHIAGSTFKKAQLHKFIEIREVDFMFLAEFVKLDS